MMMTKMPSWIDRFVHNFGTGFGWALGVFAVLVIASFVIDDSTITLNLKINSD